MSSLSYAPGAAHIEKYTGILCRDIQRVFHHRLLNQYSTRTGITHANVQAKKELIANTRRWVEGLLKLQVIGQSNLRCKRRQSVSDALAMLLRTLDNVDVENLHHISSQNGENKRTKRMNVRTQPSPCIASSSSKKRRRRPPKGFSVDDMVERMHESAVLETDEEDWNSSELYLSNADRHQRAIRSHKENQQGRSILGFSMKAVLNAQIPTESEDDGGFGDCRAVGDNKWPEDVISTLTHDAAVLRRDLYKYLAELDTVEIKAVTQQVNEIESIPMKIKDLTFTLLQRITLHSASPSMRLSAIISLDYLREFELSDGGYQCILDELLGRSTSWSLKFYAEIVSECNAYEKPILYLRSVSTLMQQALDAQKMPGNNSNPMELPLLTLLLRATSRIMVRRQNTLSSLNKLVLGHREIDVYNGLCHRISMHFDSVPDWVTPDMSYQQRERAISVLQAAGILSLFCREDSDDEDQVYTSSQSSQTIEEYPYPQLFSLRAAHERMGPCDGFNRLLSNPSSYENTITLSDFPAASGFSQPPPQDANLHACSLSIAGEDVVAIIFSFLGYRSLARASQCCVSWEQAGNAPNLWAPLYFKKYRNRNPCFEEEMALEIENAKDDIHFRKYLSIRTAAKRVQCAISAEGYDWKHIFRSKYTKEKICKAKTCDVVGCSYVIRRKDFARSHMKRHEAAVWAQSKKRDNYKVLQMKVTKLHTDIIHSEKELQLTIPAKPSEGLQSRIDIDGPDDVLRHLVLPYLNFKDILRPVCKLWTQMTDSNQLWASLYENHFDMPHTRWLAQSSPSARSNDWKLLFRSALVANYNVRGQVNCFGLATRICPKVGCNKELRNKLEYDYHVLKHKEKCYLDRIKDLNKVQREQRRLDSKRRNVARRCI